MMIVIMMMHPLVTGLLNWIHRIISTIISLSSSNSELCIFFSITFLDESLASPIWVGFSLFYGQYKVILTLLLKSHFYL